MACGVTGGVRSLGLGLALTVCLAAPALAVPAVAWVTSTADSGPGSLRQVIADAAPDTIVRLGPELSYRTITLSSELVVDKNLVVDGTGAPGVAISGNDAVRVFNIGNSGAACGITVTLRAVRVVHAGEMNGGTDSGAGILTCASTLTVELVSFENNEAVFGGAFNQTSGAAVIRDSAFIDNDATNGAALRAEGGSLALERVSITGNNGATILTLWASTIALTNVTVYGNTTWTGSTMAIGATTVATMRNVTIAVNDNQDMVGAAHTVFNQGTLEIQNSIISNPKNCAGIAPVDLGGNIESGASSCGFTSADPQLGPLGYYGSSIVQTVPIAATSPARNAGNNASCPIDDGRAKRRPRSGGDPCDIGAFEYDGPLTAIVTNLNDAGAGSLRQALADTGSGGTIDFQTGLTGDITIDSTLAAPRPVTINGPGHATLAIVRNSGAGNFRLMETGSG